MRHKVGNDATRAPRDTCEAVHEHFASVRNRLVNEVNHGRQVRVDRSRGYVVDVNLVLFDCRIDH